MEEEIIEKCKELNEKYGHLPFEEVFPSFQKGCQEIGAPYGKTSAEVFIIYFNWKAKHPV